MDRATNEKYDEEQHKENIVSPLRSQHVQASGAIFNEKDEKIKEARNVTFAAAVATGGTDPFSKAAFIVYACSCIIFFKRR